MITDTVLSPRPIKPRNKKFNIGAHTPRTWHPAGKGVTAFLNGLSIFFPEGERFFVSSVNRYRDKIQDPTLLADVRAFVAQEAFHTREHVRYNDMLREQGYPVDMLEAKVTKILGRAKRHLPARTQLAVTCALEHFTSMMGHHVLSNPAILAGADPEMVALWKWHSAEENEHKSVAFDLFTALGGGYVERTVIMTAATLRFWTKVIEHQIAMMKVDGVAASPKEWSQLLWFLFVNPGGLRGLAGTWLRYYRPGFHPSEMSSDELVEKWESTTSQAIGTA